MDYAVNPFNRLIMMFVGWPCGNQCRQHWPAPHLMPLQQLFLSNNIYGFCSWSIQWSAYDVHGLTLWQSVLWILASATSHGCGAFVFQLKYGWILQLVHDFSWVVVSTLNGIWKDCLKVALVCGMVLAHTATQESMFQGLDIGVLALGFHSFKYQPSH